MASQINEILPGLFIGNYDDAKDARQLRIFCISHIVSLMEKLKHDFDNKHYLCVQVADSPTENISDYISVVNDFIHEARLNNKNVLVHCMHGVSLSAAMIIAYIMTVTKFSWFNALNVVRAERCFALPLPGILKQLDEFQNSRLYVERCRLQFKYAARQNYLNDLNWCLKALRFYEMLYEANPNLFDKVPDIKKFDGGEPLGTADLCDGPSTSSGRKKPRKSLLLDLYPLEDKPKVDGGGILLMENVVLFPPVSQKELGTKGRFVDPIDQVKRRRRFID